MRVIGIPPEGRGKMNFRAWGSSGRGVAELRRCGRLSAQAIGMTAWCCGAQRSNSLADAALHSGPQHVVLETAAIDLAAPSPDTRSCIGQLARDCSVARQGGPSGGWQRIRVRPGLVGVRMLLHTRATRTGVHLRCGDIHIVT